MLGGEGAVGARAGWYGIANGRFLQGRDPGSLRLSSANAKKNLEKPGYLSPKLAGRCLNAAKKCWKVLADSAAENQRYGGPPERLVIGATYTPWNDGSAREYVDKGDGRYTCRPVPNTVTSAGFRSLSLTLLDLEPGKQGVFVCNHQLGCIFSVFNTSRQRRTRAAAICCSMISCW